MSKAAGNEQEWPAVVLLGRRKYTNDPLRQMPESSAQSALHDSTRYFHAAHVEALVSALEEIERARCNTHLIQGYMFPGADPRQIAHDALDRFKAGDPDAR